MGARSSSSLPTLRHLDCVLTPTKVAVMTASSFSWGGNLIRVRTQITSSKNRSRPVRRDFKQSEYGTGA